MRRVPDINTFIKVRSLSEMSLRMRADIARIEDELCKRSDHDANFMRRPIVARISIQRHARRASCRLNPYLAKVLPLRNECRIDFVLQRSIDFTALEGICDDPQRGELKFLKAQLHLYN
jgi:hypothetical protein